MCQDINVRMQFERRIRATTLRPDGSLLLSGPALTPTLVREVLAWLQVRVDKDRAPKG